MKDSPKRILRPLTEDEKSRHAQIREQVMREFPPARGAKYVLPVEGIAAELRKARKTRQLTYEAVAAEAGLANANIVKDVEYGRDAKLEHIEAIAQVLGMKLELVVN